MTASSSSRRGVLVRAPSSLKAALVRETARRHASLNDVAVGLLADALGLAYLPTGRKSPLPGSRPVLLLRMPDEVSRALQTESKSTAQTLNDVILPALVHKFGIPFTWNRRRPADSGAARVKEPWDATN